MKMNRWIVAVMVLAGPWAMGQELVTEVEEMDAIATDRPDITESAQITPVGWFQYEGGYQFSQSQQTFGAQERRDRHQVEEVLRFGINKKFEVRAVINANTENITGAGILSPLRRTGIQPVTLGFKYNLLEETEFLPQTTWLSHASFPFLVAGDYVAQFQSNTVFHEQRLMLEKSLTDRFGIASNIGFSGGLNGSNGFIDAGMFSFAAGYDLGRDFGIYLEYFSEFTWGGNQLYTTPYIDGGFTKLLSNDLQLDVYAGLDLSTEFGSRLPTNGFFFGTGVSYRFPLAAYLKSL